MGSKKCRALSIALCALSLLLVLPSATLGQGGTVWTWGSNNYGQLGDGTNTPRSTPGLVSGLAGIVAIPAGSGSHHCLAVAADGSVWAWGLNSFGNLGDGTNIDRTMPVPVSGLTSVTQAAVNGHHTLARRSDGTAWAWGRNAEGQIGDGTNIDRWTPVQVSGLTDVVQVSAGHWHSYARKSDGTVWAWGLNGSGQLGDGTTTSRTMPTPVSGLSDVVAVAGGSYFGLALKSDGTVWAWGRNDYGQLGIGSYSSSSTPVQVPNLAGIVAIDNGAHQSIALKGDGTVWTWGYNGYGQLGDGTTVTRTTPVQVLNLAEVASVSSGGHVCNARKRDGSAWAWGFNADGRLGDGTTTDQWTPVRITGLTGVVATTAGGSYGAALVPSTGTSTFTIDRSGIISESVTLRGYLSRTSDSAWLSGKAIHFTVDGTEVGSASTNASGRASLDWTVTPGRIIGAAFWGDPDYAPSSGAATLTALTFATRTYAADAAGLIGDSALLRAYLFSDPYNRPVVGRMMTFSVDGTPVGSAATNASGRALWTYGPVPEGSGPGGRNWRADWLGNGGYLASSGDAKLWASKGVSHLWVASRSAARGTNVYLRAYLRRLPDLMWLPGRTIRFYVDGSPIGTGVTDADGRASVLYMVPPDMPLGNHTIDAAFDGDASHMPTGATATLTIIS